MSLLAFFLHFARAAPRWPVLEAALEGGSKVALTSVREAGAERLKKSWLPRSRARIRCKSRTDHSIAFGRLAIRIQAELDGIEDEWTRQELSKAAERFRRIYSRQLTEEARSDRPPV